MKITIGNTRCLVEGSVEEQAWLSKLLTIETGERGFHGTTIEYSFFRVGQGSFPVGLLNSVMFSSPPSGVDVELEDARTKLDVPAEFRPLSGLEYFDFQEEALKQILSYKQGLVHVATNGGKTVIMAGLLRTLEGTGVRGVVITHRKEIFEQLTRTFNECLRAEVGAVSSEKCDVRDRQFVVAMAQTLVNRLGDDPDITGLWEEHQVLLADEAHHLQAETWRKLFSTSNARIKVGFSGTIPEDGTYKGWLVRAYTGPVLIDVRNRELVDAGISAKPMIYMHQLNSKGLFEGLYKECLSAFAVKLGINLFKDGKRWVNPHVKMRFFGHYQRECIRVGVIENTRRNSKIVKRVRDAWSGKKKQCLIIVERLAHGEILEKKMADVAVFIHGDSPRRAEALRSFKKGELGVLISSQILDEGVDISGIDVLVIAGGMKCKRELLQRVGRGLRRKKDRPNVLEVVDFMDSGNRYLDDYSKKRREVYESEGFDVEVIKEG